MKDLDPDPASEPNTRGPRHSRDDARDAEEGTSRRRPPEQPPYDGSDPKAAALYFASLGWAVLPNHTPRRDGTCSCRKPDCPNPGKHPRHHSRFLTNGIANATTDQGLIERWWDLWPDANVGIATGPSGLAVIDLDEPKNDGPTLADLVRDHGGFPATVTVETPSGGAHRYFLDPDGTVACSVKALASDADVRGVGGQVIAPPSLHGSDGRYRFKRGCGPDEIDVAPLPDWVSERLRRAKSGPKSSSRPTPKTVEEGSRNSTLARIAGRLRRAGLEETEMLAACRAVNRNRGRPPLDDTEVEKIVRSISRYPAGDGPEEWEDPVPLNAHAPPPFPVEALPGWLADWVVAEAAATATPPDFAGQVALSVVAAGVAKKARAEIRPGWSEPFNIYAVVQAKSGTRKSAVFAAGLAPVEEFEREEQRRLQPEIRRLKVKREILDKQLARLKEARAEGDGDGDRKDKGRG